MNFSPALCGPFIPSRLTVPLLLKRNGISLRLSYPLGKRENKGDGLLPCRRKPTMSSSVLVKPFPSPKYRFLSKHSWPDVLRHRKRRCCSKIKSFHQKSCHLDTEDQTRTQVHFTWRFAWMEPGINAQMRTWKVKMLLAKSPSY